jgi:hypothetical protein
MKIKDIIDMEKTNLFGITLLKEGMFYRAYNRSAMRISTKVRALKVNTKLIKYVGQTVMYCGFPDNILPQIRNLCAQKNYGWNARGETRIDIDGVATPDEDYEGWTREILKRVANAPSLVTPVMEKYSDSPRDQRDVLAGRIGTLFLEILELLVEAGYSVDQAHGGRDREMSDLKKQVETLEEKINDKENIANASLNEHSCDDKQILLL